MRLLLNAHWNYLRNGFRFIPNPKEPRSGGNRGVRVLPRSAGH